MISNDYKIIYKKTDNYDNETINSTVSTQPNESIQQNESIQSTSLFNNQINNIAKLEQIISTDYIQLFENFLSKLSIDTSFLHRCFNNDDELKLLGFLIKKFIIDNKMNQEEIIIFLNQIEKLKSSCKYDLKYIKKENFTNFSNKSESNDIFNDIATNDLNAWLFIGIISLCLVIVFMCFCKY